MRGLCMPVVAVMAGAVTLWAPGAAAADCRPLPAGFEFCAAGTSWAEARRIEFSHGVAFERERWWFEVIDLPDAFQDAPSLDGVLDAVLAASDAEAAAEGLPPSGVVTRERYRTDTLELASVTVLADPGDDTGAVPMASAIAEGGGHRIALMLDHMDDITPEALHAALREIAGMVRPAPEG